MQKKQNGFSLIEIIITITIIGILAAIGMVVYTGVQKNTNKTIAENKMAIIDNALEKYYETNGEYPSCNQMGSADVATLLDIDPEVLIAPGDTSGEQTSFIDDCGSFSDDSLGYFEYDGEGACSLDPSEPCFEYELDYYGFDEDDYDYEDFISNEKMTPDEVNKYLQCPDETNWAKVPGSETYDTNAFCVMKYEAKIDTADEDGFPLSNSMPVSKADGRVWPNVNQQEAINISSKTADCDGCHLISEAEWLTIAQNIMRMPENWTDGKLYSGWAFDKLDWREQDTSADPEDTDGYYGLEAGYDLTEKRTYLLNTGDIIWDFSGGMSEWTSGKVVGDLPSSESEETKISFNYDEFTDQGNIVPDIFPSGAGIDGVTNENAFDLGIGGFYYKNNQSGKLGFLRGIRYINESGTRAKGILDLTIIDRSLHVLTNGFRVAK